MQLLPTFDRVIRRVLARRLHRKNPVGDVAFRAELFQRFLYAGCGWFRSAVRSGIVREISPSVEKQGVVDQILLEVPGTILPREIRGEFEEPLARMHTKLDKSEKASRSRMKVGKAFVREN